MVANGYWLEFAVGQADQALRDFLRGILGREEVQAILAPVRRPDPPRVTPTLVADPAQLEAAAPLSPAFPLNGARLVARLTHGSSGDDLVAAVMRPCEIRAFVELVKFKQGSRDKLLIIGLDCLGALTNRAYRAALEQDGGNLDGRFFQSALAGQEPPAGYESAPACAVCDKPIPDGADITVGLYGVEVDWRLWVQAGTPAGEALLAGLQLNPGTAPAERAAVIEALVSRRVAARDRMMAATRELCASPDKLAAYLSACVNCYNCRVACPVCYCRECVFVTDVFDHEPDRYLKWAERQGAIRMPTDTLFFHLTRLTHMSLSCVGCGQCSNACPNDVALFELFSTMAHQTQEDFEYEAGRDILEPPPLSTFLADELADVVGI